MLKGFQERLLHYVLGVFPVVRDVLSDSKELTVVSLHEFLKGSDISTLAGMDQCQVIACRLAHRELCCLAHMRLISTSYRYIVANRSNGPVGAPTSLYGTNLYPTL